MGLRRFRACYTEVARKNAKTTILAGLTLYMLAADGEEGPEVYSGATARDQARIVLDIARRMVQKSAGLRGELGVQAHAHAISCAPVGGTFQALSSDAHTLDGLNPNMLVIDELHAHKTRLVYDVLETATGSRDQPLLWAITTAGSNRAGICYEQRGYVVKILEGIADDDRYFGVIYTIDEDDDWRDESCWPKANPNLAVSVDLDDMRRQAAKAAVMPTALPNFLTKRLNVWVNADMAWMDMQKFAACGDPSLEVSQYAGYDCFVGIDLASRNDIAAMALLFVLGEGRYALFGRYWLPENAVEASGNSQYLGWSLSGRITTTPGNTTDFGYIEQELLEVCKTFNVREVAYDPFQAAQFSQRMLDEGVPMVEVRPIVLNLSEPMKELQALVLDGDLEHDGDPCMGWQFSNVVAHLDNKDNIYPRKERVENKIDVVVAAIMALARAIVHRAEPNVYGGRGLLVLGD